MNHRTIIHASSLLLALGACATTPSPELVDAREEYRRVDAAGMTAKVAPAELHVAQTALQGAEQAYERNGNTFHARDLAYVAQRRIQIAEAIASTTLAKKNSQDATTEYRNVQGEIITDKNAALDDTRGELARSERQVNSTREQLSSSQDARADAESARAEAEAARAAAEARAQQAQQALAKLAAVEQEPRGMVVTLSGSVLFASAKYALLPGARSRIDDIADVLMMDGGRHIVVEGHTDSVGSLDKNVILSQHRAESVRSALIRRGYDASLIEAHGLGESTPIANNGTSEGRANNRRVEIVVLPEIASR